MRWASERRRAVAQIAFIVVSMTRSAVKAVMKNMIAPATERRLARSANSCRYPITVSLNASGKRFRVRNCCSPSCSRSNTGSAESTIQGLKYTTGLVTSNYEKQLQVDGGVKVQLNTTGAAGQSTTVLVATPSVGAQLTNLQSGKVMQLQGGSIELRTVSRDSDRNLISSAFRYNAVQYQLGGMSYVLDGELLFTMGGTPSTSGYSGEVLLRENGVVVGRILGNGMQISVDVQGKIQTLRAPKRYTR